jgi:large subunit ribosomal protein L1
MTAGKRFRTAVEKVNRTTRYDLESAVEFVKQGATAKFDETVEFAARLGVDPRHSEQQIRGTIVLPHGTGKTVRVLVIAKGEKEKEAQEAGADMVGSAEYVEKIQGGWTDFDALIATPDMMKEVGKLGKILGPRGLMPNPKSGTVTFDVTQAVREVKAGRIQYRTDKTGNVHVPVGKASFEKDKLVENIRTVITEIQRAKPASAKGSYWRNLTISSTMGPGVRIDVQAELLRG